jgi:tetratricopeptide (TPR) repeat protein
VLGPDSFEALSTLEHLATVWEEAGTLDKALEIRDRILAVKTRVLGENHPDIVICLNRCANVRVHVGDTNGAELCYLRGLALAEKTLGVTHPGTQEIRKDAAHSLLSQGRREEALALINRPLTPEVLSSAKALPMLEDRADLLGRAGMWKEAALDFERLIQISPSNHMYYMKLLPLLLWDGKREHYQSLCRHILKNFGPTDEITAGRVASVCLMDPPAESLGEISRLAEFALDQAIKRTNNTFLPERQCILARVRYRQNRLDEAIELATKAAGIKIANGMKDFTRVGAHLLLSKAYRRQGRIDAADECLKAALAIISTLPSPKGPDMGFFWNNLVGMELSLREAEQPDIP